MQTTQFVETIFCQPKDTNLSGESMAMKSLRKINTKSQFLYTKSLCLYFLVHFDKPGNEKQITIYLK